MPANKIKLEPTLERRYARQSKRRKARQIVCKILIVCEGTKTEPNYFKAFQKINQGTFVYDIEVKGLGKNTINVVDKAIDLRNKAMGTESEYDRVWAVFDKDSFPEKNFNAAVNKAHSNHIECAWSNEAFELWYLYHFTNRITPMPRDLYKESISKAVNCSGKYKQKNYIYEKNKPENFKIMTTCGSQIDAIRWAEAKSKEYIDRRYAKHNPCTMVFKLVQQLIGQDKKLNDELARRVG